MRHGMRRVNEGDGVSASRKGARRKRLKKARKTRKKCLDAAVKLCYIMNYLSTERSVFVRFFENAAGRLVGHREAMLGLPE